MKKEAETLKKTRIYGRIFLFFQFRDLSDVHALFYYYKRLRPLQMRHLPVLDCPTVE